MHHKKQDYQPAIMAAMIINHRLYIFRFSWRSGTDPKRCFGLMGKVMINYPLFVRVLFSDNPKWQLWYQPPVRFCTRLLALEELELPSGDSETVVQHNVQRSFASVASSKLHVHTLEIAGALTRRVWNARKLKDLRIARPCCHCFVRGHVHSCRCLGPWNLAVSGNWRIQIEFILQIARLIGTIMVDHVLFESALQTKQPHRDNG